MIYLILFMLFLAVIGYLFVGKAPLKEDITWGMNFSQMHAENLGLNWKEAYLALLDDLSVRNIKILTNWNFVEKKNGEYNFEDIDWQIKEAERRVAKVIYVVGMKTGRWPECHLPGWALSLSKEEQQKEILEYIKDTVLRYKDSKAITAWQAENEPLFRFGICPWYDKNFLVKEVELIKSLDKERPAIISDSGEYSLWFQAAKIGDIVGTTMYRKVWVHITEKLGFYSKLLFPPKSYWLKAKIVEKIFGKKVINIELQAEPWFKDIFEEVSLEEQEKTMNLEKFRENIEFAKKSGFDTFYLWGGEWMYWMKEKKGESEIWNEAKKLFIK